MSKLDELIQEYCPNGVEYKKLGEIGKFYSGLSGKSKEDFKDGNKKYITYMNVFSNIAINTDIKEKVRIDDNERQNTVKYGDIIFTGSSETPNECGMSSVFTKQVNEDLFLNSFCFGYRLNDNNILLPEFSKYVFRSEFLRKQIIKTASGVTRFNVSKKKMENVILPVPPLEVQREIVRILDNFTLLTAELTAELTARKKQYEHYRDKLLKYENNIPRVRLGDICSVITKGTTPKKYADKGISFIKTESFNGTRIDFKKISYIDEITHNTFLKRSILEENDILITIAGATIGKCLMVPKEILPANTNQALAIIRVKKDILCKYVMYVLQSYLMKKYIRKNIKGSAQPNLNLQQLNDFIVPFPPLETQKRIVHVLDNFEKICSDLNIGLPAEIEARQKQYEYYRDALLTFAAKGDIIVNRTEQNRTEHQYELIKLIQYVFGFVTVQLKDIAFYVKDRIDAQKLNTETYIGVDNLLPNKRGKTSSIYVPESGMLTKYLNNDILIGNIRPYLQKIWFASNIGGTNGDVLVIRPYDTAVILPKFLYHVLASDRFFIYDNNNAKGAKMPRGNKEAVMNYEFTIPSMQEQERIVAVLDRFDALCNDLTCGLPAEIAARQKQYEYYRDKLLTFKEAK